MRKFAAYNYAYFSRIERIESRQLVSEQKIIELFRRIDEKERLPSQGIFYDGQIYDAYTFAAELVRRAERRIILIDNYIDDTVLTLLDKRKDKVAAIVYTSRMIDDEIYLIGASIKDLGKKWFGFTLIESVTPEEILRRI